MNGSSIEIEDSQPRGMITDKCLILDHPTSSDIRERAYQLYESSGGLPGRTLTNWLRAEAELRRELWHAFNIAEERSRRRMLFARTASRDDGAARNWDRNESA